MCTVENFLQTRTKLHIDMKAFQTICINFKGKLQGDLIHSALKDIRRTIIINLGKVEFSHAWKIFAMLCNAIFPLALYS